MAKKKLESFKIEDMQKSMPRSARSRDVDEPDQQAPSAGFPNIEHLIEQEHLDITDFDLRMQALKNLAEDGSAQEKGGARKALAAYERTVDLIEFLWETKGGLAEGAGES